MKTGIELIADERTEQIEKHGRTVLQDVSNNEFSQLCRGAILLLDDEEREDEVPFRWNEEKFFKMKRKSYKERLIIAGALIAAEIDRLQK